MQIKVDTPLYQSIARPFTQIVVNRLVLGLARSGKTSFAFANPTEVDVSAMYEVLFGLLVSFEDHAGFSGPGGSYVPHTGFATTPQAPAEIVMSWERTGLHGSLDDAMILEAMGVAAAAVKT